MTDARVIQATFTEWRMVKTRKVLQLVLEIPLEQQGEVLTHLGPPMPDQEKWVAVALLDPKAQLKDMLVRSLAHENEEKRAQLKLVAKERYAQMTLEEQAVVDAGRLAKDPRFWAWACKDDEMSAATFIRDRCDIITRAHIATNARAYRAFIDMKMQYWTETGQMAENRG